MTLTFSEDTYINLLTQYRPKVIKTEAENERAIAIAQDLEHRPQRTPEEDAFLELLVLLIEKFEEQQYPIPKQSPRSTLLHLMEENNLKQEDLIGILGSRGVVSEVVNGKRNLSKAQAKSLADYFTVEVGLFI